MSSSRAFLLVAGLALAASLALSAQEPPCQRRTVVVNVVDKNGDQVWELTPADFRGEFRGQPVKILAVAVDPPPHRVVILLDASGSMSRVAKWDLARKLARDILQPSPFTFLPALVVFSREVRQEVGFEGGNEAVAAALAALEDKGKKFEATGQTALLDAILRALAMLSPSRVGDTIYLLTDGGENFSGARDRDVERMMVAGGIRLFVFLIAEPLGTRSEPELVAGAESVSKLAEVSGGSLRAVFAGQFKLSSRDHGALAQQAKRIFHRPMAMFYLIQVELPQEPDKARGWKLEVVNPAGKRRKNLTVLYPQKLLPCPDTSSPAPKP